MDPIIECVPNFSESSNPATLQAIAASLSAPKGALLLGGESDPDHHRSVFTLVGPPAAIQEAAVLAVITAARHIDLTAHSGAHPRIGAADVVPFVPLHGITMDECAALARRAGEEIWQRAGVPVYFYEFAATIAGRQNLETVRKVGFESLRRRALEDLSPDIGGPAIHPTAGACAIGARRLLIACNVNLANADLATAKRIAKAIRTSSGGLPYVKALGLELPKRGLVQVSMNLTHYEVTSLATVFGRILALGGRPHSTEIIGFPPLAALAGARDFLEICDNWSPSRILENRIAEFTGIQPQSADLPLNEQSFTYRVMRLGYTQDVFVDGTAM